MMKKSILALGLLIAFMAVSCASTASSSEKTYKVGSFTSIKLYSVGNIVFTQSDAYSCRLEGAEESVKNTLVFVKDGELIIEWNKGKGKNNARNIRNLTIYVSAPDLSEVSLSGVGGFTAKDTLNLQKIAFRLSGVGNVDLRELRCTDLSLDMSGVGDIKANVDCGTVVANMSGVGSITLTGKAEVARLNRSGVGNIDSKGLKVAGN